MNNVCFPIGLMIRDKICVPKLCIKKSFDYHMERKILNKLYGDETKSISFKNTKHKTQKKTKKRYS